MISEVICVDRRKHQQDMCGINDCGAEPSVVNIDRAVRTNPFFRTALWTGGHLQITLMSIPVGEDIGLEVHPHLDQFIKIEDGCAHVMMGKNKEEWTCQQKAGSGCAVLVPAGTWHNIVNIGCVPLKLYSVYAPPQHPFGTVHKTKAEAQQAEKH